MWETRHGFPPATRLPSGHRRYGEHTVDLVRQVQRQRDAGVRLEAAIAQALPALDPPAPSVYAELRRRHPGLLPHRLSKGTLLALTWALEDECCARAQRPWLFGAFQRERYYRQAEARWHDLARTARGAWAFADFPAKGSRAAATGGPAPTEVPLPATAPMTREWSLVCHAPDLPAALAAWELPGQQGVPDHQRLFESVWTLAAAPVRDAARVCARVAGDLGHDTGAVLEELDRPTPPAVPDLSHATAVFNRVLAYVERVR
jgi:DICT domain-containing protein